MENRLKFKSPSGVSVTVDFDASHPVVLEVISADTESTVIVKDPTNQTATVEFIGGRERRG